MHKLTSRIKKGVENNSEEIDVKVKPFFCNLIYFPIYKALETVRRKQTFEKNTLYILSGFLYFSWPIFHIDVISRFFLIFRTLVEHSF